MNAADVRATLTRMVGLALRDPREAGRQVIAWQFDSPTLWTALALAAAVNTMIFTLSLFLSPAGGVPAFFASPLVMFVLLTGVLVVTVHGLYWTGRALGGVGELRDMLALIVFLQVLRIIAQVGVFALMLISPGLSLLASLAVGLVGLWILLNFIAVAFDFQSLGKAIGVLLVAMLGVILGLSVLLSMIGLTAGGGLPNV